MKIVAGSASRNIAKNLAEKLKTEVAHTEIKRFPDGEVYIRLFENLDDQEVILVQNTYPDSNIIELLLLQDAIRQYKIRKLITVIPYFGYGRQDKRFNEGEPVSARLMAKIVQLNSDQIIVVNLHDSSTLKWFDAPAFEVRAEYALAKYIERFKPDIIISPDRGSIERAKYVADLLNVKYDHFEKKRISVDKVVIEKKDLDVQGKVVAIVDDMISTGGTIIAAAQILKEQKAEKIVVGCIHGIFVNNSLQKLEMYVDAIISTDTIENEKSVVTVADLIYDQLMKNNLS